MKFIILAKKLRQLLIETNSGFENQFLSYFERLMKKLLAREIILHNK